MRRIAHRLATILAADQILVVKDGYIAERGTHASLMAEHGVYSELFEAQAFAGRGEVTSDGIGL